MFSRNSFHKPLNVRDTRPHRIENKESFESKPLSLCLHACRITHVNYTCPGHYKLHFQTNRNVGRYAITIPRTYRHVQIVITVSSTFE